MNKITKTVAWIYIKFYSRQILVWHRTDLYVILGMTHKQVDSWAVGPSWRYALAAYFIYYLVNSVYKLEIQ